MIRIHTLKVVDASSRCLFILFSHTRESLLTLSMQNFMSDKYHYLIDSDIEYDGESDCPRNYLY